MPQQQPMKLCPVQLEYTFTPQHGENIKLPDNQAFLTQHVFIYRVQNTAPHVAPSKILHRRLVKYGALALTRSQCT